MLDIVCLHHAVEPRVSPRDIVQRASLIAISSRIMSLSTMSYLIIASEYLSVLAQLRVAVPIDQPSPRVIPQRLHNQTRLRQRSLPLRNLSLRKYDLKVLAHLLEQLALQVRHITAQRRNLVDGAIALEVRHELNNRLQQLRTLAVLATLAQTAQLLVRRRQHLQTLQRRHREREVLLRAVQTLDVGRHLGDGLLRVHRAGPHALDLAEEVGQLRLCGLDALHAVGIGRGLRGDDARDVFVQVMVVAAQSGGGGGDGGEGLRVVEDGVEVLDRVVVSCIERQRAVHVFTRVG